MLEAAMYAGIGFLTAVILMLTLMPLVHQRAVRLTTRRLQSATPPLVTEIHAQRDLLRAEHAMNIRRLEVCVAEAKASATGCRIELGRKSAEVEQLKVELADATDLVLRLHEQQRPQPPHRTMTARQVGKLALYVFKRSRRGRKAKLTARPDNIDEWTLVPARF